MRLRIIFIWWKSGGISDKNLLIRNKMGHSKKIKIKIEIKSYKYVCVCSSRKWTFEVEGRWEMIV